MPGGTAWTCGPDLTDLLRRIAAVAPGDTTALDTPLPDRWVAAHPEDRLEQREEESREAQARRGRKPAARRIAVAQYAMVTLNSYRLGFGAALGRDALDMVAMGQLRSLSHP